MKTTLGGERLGAGNKQDIHMRNYERSSHDLSYIWRSTMASGTLVPFMSELMLPGDTFDIDLQADIMTHPTIGPLFGSYKVQLDVFTIPIRLYNGKLHMNMLGIGLDMSKIKLPQWEFEAHAPNTDSNLDTQQINPSSILAYLGISGLGSSILPPAPDYVMKREFQCIPWLGYWDIYKNYYANKQEEIGAVIHNDLLGNDYGTAAATVTGVLGTNPVTLVENEDLDPINEVTITAIWTAEMHITFTLLVEINPDTIYIQWGTAATGAQYVKATSIFENVAITANQVDLTGYIGPNGSITTGNWYIDNTPENLFQTSPKIVTFPLTAIDDTKAAILADVGAVTAYKFNKTLTTEPPYSLIFNSIEPEGDGVFLYSKQSSQEGLALKTYQSDLFNNWISTEWLDGDNGVNAITAIQVVDGEFTIDQLNLQKKIYMMLNRIALTGGTYDDWLDATYTHERNKSVENPIYLGGLSKELAFQEVISNSGNTDQPLGTLAGRGVLTKKHKGGKVHVRCDEPSYVMGIVSLTPRIDYSQGNKWDMTLKTMDDFHKPALDEIGFQDLVTDQMAWWDTRIDDLGTVTYKSAGKQPAWINYMTNVNRIYGNFAIENEQMFMVLARRYEPTIEAGDTVLIKDLTTYIDPSKFNHIFADTRLDAQNFWVQIGVDIFARRKMSAKVIPNL